MSWKLADRISDRIVDLINEERARPEFSPTQAFAGQLLALMAFGRTSPRESAPIEFRAVMQAVERCLDAMLPDNASV